MRTHELNNFIKQCRRKGTTSVIKEASLNNDVYILCANEEQAKSMNGKGLSVNSNFKGLNPKAILVDNYEYFGKQGWTGYEGDRYMEIEELYNKLRPKDNKQND